jgi:hypothetical protein
VVLLSFHANIAHPSDQNGGASPVMSSWWTVTDCVVMFKVDDASTSFGMAIDFHKNI